jgi:hypothetical protein
MNSLDMNFIGKEAIRALANALQNENCKLIDLRWVLKAVFIHIFIVN